MDNNEIKPILAKRFFVNAVSGEELQTNVYSDLTSFNFQGVSGEAEGDDIRALLPRDVQEPRASLLGSDVTRRLPEFSGLPDPG